MNFTTFSIYEEKISQWIRTPEFFENIKKKALTASKTIWFLICELLAFIDSQKDNVSLAQEEVISDEFYILYNPPWKTC